MITAKEMGVKSLREVVENLQHVLESFPHLADCPLWIDAGPPQYKPVVTVGVTPGPRGHDHDQMRSMMVTLKD